VLKKVLITDDHAIIRMGLVRLLQHLLPGATVLEAVSRLSTLSMVREHPDLELLLLDLNLPDGHGLRTAEEVLALRPLLPVAIVSSEEDPAVVRRALALGLVGYIPKSTNAELTENALSRLLAGGSYWPRAAAPDRAGGLHPGALGDRQQEVLRAVCRGLSNKQIAAELGLTEATVKAHLTQVFRVLKVNSRSQAIAAMLRQPPDAPSG
jgi:DNA-binding NarL/FixJ family response regulator